jgi:pyruvate-ferredoxin/flavodoxin oxidoreductase
MTHDGPSSCLDGNEATARVAYALSEVVAIYPITPASPMGESADAWAAAGRPNLWGAVPEVIEMQSEGGAAGTLHGALQGGALATTFTASQGLLLMVPNLFKVAGELTPGVVHVAARSVATHALSIFCDHSDVMAARTTGAAMLCSGSVQEAHDLALVAHAATLRSRVPFLHFFDGFRTSHEINQVRLLGEDDLAALIDDDLIGAHRRRSLDPDRPVVRGTAQNPDVFFQAREAANPFHDATPGIVQATMDELAERTGRRYGLVDYVGHPEAERVLVLMGSASGAAGEVVDALVGAGQRVGLLQVRLFRPFPAASVAAALPASVTRVAVLDRTKEPGSVGEPLFLDVLATLVEHRGGDAPLVIGGRYGLGSKEFTPAHVRGVLDELGRPDPRRRVTVGIVDDVGGTSVAPIEDPQVASAATGAVLHGLGSDGMVGASKTAVKVLGEHTDLHAQGYFVYDSKKSGSHTVSHLRFGPDPIRSTYLVDDASLVVVSRFDLVDTVDVVDRARPGATLLVNSPLAPEALWDRMPRELQERIVELGLRVLAVDADGVASDVGLPGYPSAVLIGCVIDLLGVLDRDAVIAALDEAIEAGYGGRGRTIVMANRAAARRGLEAVAAVPVPASASAEHHRRPPVLGEVDDFVERVTARLLAGEGDLLPVSALPVDGTFPPGTARLEKRALAREVPIWEPDLCIDCGRCAAVCPHAAIRLKLFEPDALDGAPTEFRSKTPRARDLDDLRLSIQLAPDDCTGCGVCVDICPARSKEEVKRKAINMTPIEEHRVPEREAFSFFESIATLPPGRLAPDTVKGAQARLPLFEFSGACAGCGETPYIKLMSQLFGDRAVVANATGCSSIYGGNLPTTPWGTDPDGRGPAWANSLFEDNAEFGLGLRLALDSRAELARHLATRLAADLGEDLVAALLDADQAGDVGIEEQRARVADLLLRLGRLDGPDARRLEQVAGDLVDRSVWIVGGDGWAYDIGFGGVDHVLASGRDVNLLVLDTEVYSNTGGQASKATARGAVAKFATGGKSTAKKDLGLMATDYGDVYVAQVAMGANDLQATRAFLEAEAWPGPSLIIAYSTCIAHGLDMSRSMSHQKVAVKSGYWPLYRYRPGPGEHEHPFHLDSRAPSVPLKEFTEAEGRYALLANRDPERAAALAELAQADVDERWRLYEQLAGVERTAAVEEDETP